jgi:hypothetical protein
MPTKTAPAALLLLAALALGGCVSIRPSTALPKTKRHPVLALERSLPKDLPAKSSPFPHSQFVLIAPENFIGLISPIPFVAELVTKGIHANRAQDFEAKYRDIHPYLIATAVLQDSPLLGQGPARFVLKPFVFLQQCSDDRYRLAYVFQLEKGDWVGRYIVHLPTTYTVTEVTDPTPEVLATLRRELTEGATTLRGLLEREAAGGLPATGVKANVGSPHLAGVRALGLVGTSLILARDTEVIEETADHLLVRIPGDMTLPASSGGLFFGVHWLRRDQLETFQKQ